MILDAWLKSPGHRRTMLRADWRDHGLAMASVRDWMG